MVPRGGARANSGRKKKDGEFVSNYVGRDIRANWKRASKALGLSQTAILEAALLAYFKRHKIPLTEPDSEISAASPNSME
jgi:hypothetical protein